MGFHTKVFKEPSLSNYLLIAGERIVGFITFWRVLALNEMQTAFYRIWTQVAIWWWGSSDARALGNVEHPFIAIAPRFTLAPEQ